VLGEDLSADCFNCRLVAASECGLQLRATGIEIRSPEKFGPKAMQAPARSSDCSRCRFVLI
jgi:hypothetical protein